MDTNLQNFRVAIIGLGYVGLPLAVEFGKILPTIGFDLKAERISELCAGHDATLEVSSEELSASKFLQFSSSVNNISDCNFYVITVPTPVDEFKQPDLRPLLLASKTIGSVLKRGDIVVYESTVYPGATEEECVPILENISGLKFNTDFYCGYSPERINPGDKEHKLKSIKKITSGSTPEIANIVDFIYRQIITAGTYKAQSIKVAEAAKVIENTQRDLNIALINELAIIFNRLQIDTESVLLAAGTKWNFQAFKPGLVGGHCIGVDPYYLTHKAQSIGYQPELILAGRRINDSMGAYVASQLIKAMSKKEISLRGAKVLILGFAFKENCPDLRNTRVIDVVNELVEFGCKVDIYDPWVSPSGAEEEYGVQVFNHLNEVKNSLYDAIIIAVAHKVFVEMGIDNIRALGAPAHLLYDLKYIFPENLVDLRL